MDFYDHFFIYYRFSIELSKLYINSTKKQLEMIQHQDYFSVIKNPFADNNKSFDVFLYK